MSHAGGFVLALIAQDATPLALVITVIELPLVAGSMACRRVS